MKGWGWFVVTLEKRFMKGWVSVRSCDGVFAYNRREATALAKLRNPIRTDERVIVHRALIDPTAIYAVSLNMQRNSELMEAYMDLGVQRLPPGKIEHTRNQAG